MAELIDKQLLEDTLSSWLLTLADKGKQNTARYDAVEQLFDVVSDFPAVDRELQSPWHPASEIPPLTRRSWCDDGETFTFYESAPLLLMLSDGDMKTGWFNRSGTGDLWMDDCGQTYNHRITHWMERPKPPKEAVI